MKSQINVVRNTSGHRCRAFARAYLRPGNDHRDLCPATGITAGLYLTNASTQSYPAQLQTLLGSGYTVINDGTPPDLAEATGYSYWNSWAYTNSLNSQPNIVIIISAQRLPCRFTGSRNFNSDYLALISSYTNLATHPRVMICYTTPMFPVLTNYGMYFDPVFVETSWSQPFATIATQAGVQLIDNDTPLLNRPDLFHDGVHPTVDGAAIVAQTVYNAIKGLAPTNITTAAITSSANPSVYGSPVKLYGHVDFVGRHGDGRGCFCRQQHAVQHQHAFRRHGLGHQFACAGWRERRRRAIRFPRQIPRQHP